MVVWERKDCDFNIWIASENFAQFLTPGFGITRFSTIKE